MKEKWENSFEEYVKKYDMTIKPIEYKFKHSLETEKLMEKLAISLKLSEEEIKIAKLIGLLHDIGRFEQAKKYGKCSDVSTNTDHADESCKYLFEENHIRDFITETKYDNVIKNAIKWHNKLAIPKDVTGKELLFSKMIRDMDKVDIYRVIYEEYTFSYNKKEISEKVLDTFNKKMTINSYDKKTKSDGVLQRIAFLFDINFKESFKILKETGYFEKFLSTIDVSYGSNNDFNKKKKDALKYINERI